MTIKAFIENLVTINKTLKWSQIDSYIEESTIKIDNYSYNIIKYLEIHKNNIPEIENFIKVLAIVINVGKQREAINNFDFSQYDSIPEKTKKLFLIASILHSLKEAGMIQDETLINPNRFSAFTSMKDQQVLAVFLLFIKTNPAEEKILEELKNRKKIGNGTAQGIIDLLKLYRSIKNIFAEKYPN